ncbi:MAG: hypothetical protein PUD16_02890 [bacterium]|nr:hypothetical protein [bacterium]
MLPNRRPTLVPSALESSFRPCENEIRVKPPSLRHHERPEDATHG